MDNNTKHQIKSTILDYLKNKIPDFQKKGKMFTCPFQHVHERREELSANIFPEGSNRIKCFDPMCKFKGDIFDVCRKLECDDDTLTNDDIAEYLIMDMDIKTDNVLDKLFSKYEATKWDMVPVSKGSKASNIEKEWQIKTHIDKNEWMDWIYSKINIGVKTGKRSNIIIADIDAMPKPIKDLIYGMVPDKKATKKQIADAIVLRDENIQKVYKVLGVSDNDTLAQHTFGGVHLIFEYDEAIPKCTIEIEGIHIDIQTDGGQCVVEPSVVRGYERKFNENKIIELPENVKTLILDQKGKKKEAPVEEKRIISPNAEACLSFENLNGNCNNTFTHLGGILRKTMTLNQTKHSLQLFNKLLDVPMQSKDINGICQQIDKYHEADISIIKEEIVKFLARHKEAGIRDLTDCLGFDKKDTLSAIADLIEDNKIFKQKNLYKPINKAIWKTAFIEESKIIPYDVPYFQKFCTFRNGDMICVGAMPGVGKTHIAMNVIKLLTEQKIQPPGEIRYVTSEPGGRFGVVATSLGLKEEEYYYAKSYEPENLELEDNAFTIIDWLLPEDFAGTANLYQRFAKQLDIHGGVLVIFSQLNDKGNFYAHQMVKMFATFACKYFYGTKNGLVDNINTRWETEKIRESKVGGQYITIKNKYNVDTKRLELA